MLTAEDRGELAGIFVTVVAYYVADVTVGRPNLIAIGLGAALWTCGRAAIRLRSRRK